MKKICLLPVVLVSMYINHSIAQTTFFVDHSASGNQTGTSWTNAFNDLQPAIDQASVDDSIFVAKGLYKPTLITGGTSNHRDKAFFLKNGVGIYGGFDGSESKLNDRDYSNIYLSNKTILSGDLGTANDSSDNSYHVIVAINTANNTILDGFYIKGGNADDSSTNVIGITMTERNFGGGIYASNADLTIKNCRIHDNIAYSGGAGMENRNCGSGTEITYSMIYNNNIWGKNPNDFGGGGIRNVNSSPDLFNVQLWGNRIENIQGGGAIRNETSSPTLDSVQIKENHAYNGDGGAGIYNAKNSNPHITNSEFINNYTINQGAGMYNDNSKPIIEKVVFGNNEALDGGGAMENDGGSHATLINVDFISNNTDVNGGAIQNWKSSPTIEDVLFKDNNAGQDGGALYNYNDCSPRVTNVEFRNNTAIKNGGAIYNRRNCHPVITNVLVHLNKAGKLGGGIYTESGGTPCSPIVTNATIVNNTADSSGGGGYDDGLGNPKLRNSIVMYNHSVANDDIDAPSTLIATALTSVIIGSDFYLNGSTLPTTVTGQLFLDTAQGDLRLYSSSFAIDKGDKTVFNSGKTPDLSSITTDLIGNARTMMSNTDLGAYEVCGDTTVPYLFINAFPPLPFFIGENVQFNIYNSTGGANQKYIWMLNNTILSNTDSVLSGIAQVDFKHGDTVTAIMVSEEQCTYPKVAYSNSIIVEVIVGINDKLNSQSEYTLFPNPNNGTFEIKGNFKAETNYLIRVLDVTGKEVVRKDLRALKGQTIKLKENLKKGFHILNIVSEDDGIISIKFHVM